MTVNINCKNEAQSLFQGPARNSIVEKQKGKRETNNKKNWEGINQKVNIYPPKTKPTKSPPIVW